MQNYSHCLTLKDLPSPPAGRTGFPWTEQSQPLPDRLPDGSEYPRISIVAPSYNQGIFLEETIRSVLLQGYPNLEYIIIDGGSNDESVEIIKKYDRFLTYWVSEPDSGQTNAINKGIQRISGQIFAWLNSDDVYAKDALKHVAQSFQTEEFALLCGQCEFMNAESERLYQADYTETMNLLTVLADHQVAQPSCFINTNLFKSCGSLNEDLHYSFDYDYWVRLLLQDIKIHSAPILLSRYRLHQQSKTETSRPKFDREIELVHQNALSHQSSVDVKRAIAKCYRRFASEYYFWYGDRATSMSYFHKMMQTDPLACDLSALKIYGKNLLNKKHYAKS